MNRELPPAPIFNADGTLNEPILMRRFGIGIAEAMQEVEYKSEGALFKGTFAEALADWRCPVAGKLEKAYQLEGIGGVMKTIEAVNVFLDNDKQVHVTQETLMRHQGKKIRPAGESR